MKLLFGAALISVIEAAELQSEFYRRGHLAHHGFPSWYQRLAPTHPVFYGPYKSKEYRIPSYEVVAPEPEPFRNYVETSDESISDDSSDSAYDHRSFSSHGGSGLTHSHDSTSDYLKGTSDSHFSSASDLEALYSDEFTQYSGLDGSDDSFFSKDSKVYDHRWGGQPYSEEGAETDGSSYDSAHSLSLDSSDDAFGTSDHSGHSGYSWDSNGSGISSANGH